MTSQDNAYVTRFVVKLITTDDTCPPPDVSKLNGNRENVEELYRTYQLSGRHAAAEHHKKMMQMDKGYAALFNATPPKWELLHHSELHKIPPSYHLINGMIVACGFNVMYGLSGGGKSFITIDLCARIAQKMKVYYVAAEGASGYDPRKQAWELANKKSAGELYFIGKEVNLFSETETDEFIDAFKTHTPQLIVFDTLAMCMRGGDENSARDMGIVISNCRRIQKQLNTAILVVHHTGKSGNSERGSSALRGAADSMIEVSNSDGLITVESSKLKDGKPFDTYHMRLVEFGTSVAPMFATKVIDVPGQALTKTEKAVLEALNLAIFAESGAKSSQLKDHLNNVPINTLYKVLSRLKQQNLIVQGVKGDPFSITEAGKAAIS